MGRAKEQQLLEFEQGWRFFGDERACRRCAAGDRAIEEFLEVDGVAGTCSYCLRRNSKTVAMNDLMGFIFEGVRAEYGQADEEGLPVVEGSYLVQPYDGDELLFWILGLEIDGELLHDAIESATRDFQWCPRHPLAPRPHEQSIYSWHRFARVVKHQVRFLFAEHSPSVDWTEEAEAPYSPQEILQHIGDRFVAVPSAFRSLATGTVVYRARWGASERGYVGTDLGAPPPERATRTNRMSPPGISLFYGAMDERTALLETVGRTDTEQRARPFATVAKWTLVRPVHVVDLTHSPPIPSVFDAAAVDGRTAARFLSEFRKELAIPIEVATEPYDYVPTQILTEYLRLVARSTDGKRIEGMLYPSARDESGRNIVLFSCSDACWLPGIARTDSHVVALDEDSVRSGISIAEVLRS